MHEFVHKFSHLFIADALLADTHVEWVIEIVLRVRSEVETDRDCRFRTDSVGVASENSKSESRGSDIPSTSNV